MPTWLARGRGQCRGRRGRPAGLPAASSGGARPRRATGCTPLRAEQETLEKQIAELTRERVSLEAELADPAVYEKRAVADQHKLAQRHRKVGAQIEALEERWLAVTSELEERAW